MMNTLVNKKTMILFLINIFNFQLALLIFGSFLADAAPRLRAPELRTAVGSREDELKTPIDKIEAELQTSIDKREAELHTSIEKREAELETQVKKREADPMPPIGSCGC